MPVLDPLPPVLHHSTLNLLAGASGVGKTALLTYIARCFLKGEPLFGMTPAQVPVGYIGMDRAWSGDSERWFTKAGIPEIPHYSLIEDEGFKLSRFTHPKANEHAQIFEEMIDKVQLPVGSVVIVDPLALCIGADMNHYVRAAVGCMALGKVIRRRQLCVIGVDHSSKQKGDSGDRYTRLQDRISGSMAKLGYSSTQMYLAGPDEMGEDCHTFLWNPHHAPSKTFKIKQDPSTGLFLPPDLHPIETPGAAVPDQVKALTADLQALYVQLPEFFATATVLTLFADIPRTTIWRRLKALQTAGYVRHLGQGRWQRLERASEEAKEESGSVPETPPDDSTP